jgi:hypothetical protein
LLSLLLFDRRNKREKRRNGLIILIYRADLKILLNYSAKIIKYSRGIYMKFFRPIIILFLLTALRAMAMEGIEEVKRALESSDAKKLYLIIGVRCGEDGFNERFSHLLQNPNIFVIFGDYASPIENIEGHCLKGDFNSASEIAELVQNFPASFDVISTDGLGTAKFLIGYNDEIIKLLAKSLKPQGTFFYHDVIEEKFYSGQAPLSSNTVSLSLDDMKNYRERLAAILGSGFKKLPATFYLPREVFTNLEVSDESVDELTNKVLRLIDNYQPQQFFSIINELNSLGLGKAGLTQGRDFKVREKAQIKPLVKNALQENIFREHNMPIIVADLKGIIKKAISANLSNEFSSIEVVSQDSDIESLDVLVPKDRNKIGYIVYKLKK